MDVKKFIGWCIKGIRMKLRRMPKEHKRFIIYSIIVLFIGGMLFSLWWLSFVAGEVSALISRSIFLKMRLPIML